MGEWGNGVVEDGAVERWRNGVVEEWSDELLAELET